MLILLQIKKEMKGQLLKYMDTCKILKTLKIKVKGVVNGCKKGSSFKIDLARKLYKLQTKKLPCKPIIDQCLDKLTYFG